MNKEKKLETIDKSEVQMPGFDWLSADYTMQTRCQEPLVKALPPGMLKLFHVKEITFDDEDESPRQEALENVFASLKIRGVNLVYLILGECSKVSFYFGVAADLQEPQNGINLDEIADKILAPSLRGNFRGSRVEAVDAKELKRIRQLIADDAGTEGSAKLLFSCMEGVPGVTKDKEKKDFQGVDRLVDIMLNHDPDDKVRTESDGHEDDFGLMVVAKPINDMHEVVALERALDEIYRWIMLKSRQQCQTGQNESKNEGSTFTNGTQESTAEGKNKSSANSIAWNASNQFTKGKSHSEGYSPRSGGHHDDDGTNESGSQTKGRTDSTSYTTGESVQVTRSVMEQMARQSGSQVGSSMSLSFDIVSKSMQDWTKYFDDVVFPRLDCAKGKGLFVSSTLLFARQKPVLTKLENVVKSIFSGEVGNRSPLHAIRLSSDRKSGTAERLWTLKNFQQPLLVHYRDDTVEDCYAATAHSKCLHLGQDANGKIVALGFYGGDWMSATELSLIAGLPKKEVIGLRLREEVEFGLNVKGDAKRPMRLGTLVQGGVKTSIPVDLDAEEFDRHMFVAGVTGSGKTTTCQRILCESNRHFLVIEPAKTEYRILRKYDRFEGAPKDNILIFTLGNDKVAPFRLNPLEFTEGETISSRVDMLMASITAAFDMEAAIPQLIEQAIYECYKKYGWNDKTDENRYFPGSKAFEPGVYAFPTLGDVMDVMPDVIKRQGFDERLYDEYLGSIRARLQGLLVGAKGMMLNCKRSIDFDDLLDRNVILELEEVRNGSEKALIIGFVLTNLLVAIKRRFREGRAGKKNVKVEHITLVEEAHRLMTKFQPGDNPNKKHAVEMFADMLAEIRKYGESMIIADQIPNKLTPDVLKNTNIKIVHRLFAQDDKDVIGSTMSLSEEQRDFLSNLDIGHAIVFSGNWPKAMHVNVEQVEGLSTSSSEEIPDEELRCQALDYYAATWKRGVFPGLETLKKRPSIEMLEKYIAHVQNVDLRNFFNEERAEGEDEGDIFRQIDKMISLFGKDLALTSLSDIYLVPFPAEPGAPDRKDALLGYLEERKNHSFSNKFKKYVKTIKNSGKLP